MDPKDLEEEMEAIKCENAELKNHIALLTQILEKNSLTISKFEALEGKMEILIQQNDRLSQSLHFHHKQLESLLLEKDREIEELKVEEERKRQLEEFVLRLLEKNEILNELNSTLLESRTEKERWNQ